MRTSPANLSIVDDAEGNRIEVLEFSFEVCGQYGPISSPDRLLIAIRQELLQTVDQTLVSASAASDPFELDQLELDLGDFPIPVSWDEVRRRLRDTLESALAPYLTASKQDEYANSASALSQRYDTGSAGSEEWGIVEPSPSPSVDAPLTKSQHPDETKDAHHFPPLNHRPAEGNTATSTSSNRPKAQNPQSPQRVKGINQDRSNGSRLHNTRSSLTEASILEALQAGGPSAALRMLEEVFDTDEKQIAQFLAKLQNSTLQSLFPQTDTSDFNISTEALAKSALNTHASPSERAQTPNDASTSPPFTTQKTEEFISGITSLFDQNLHTQQMPSHLSERILRITNSFDGLRATKGDQTVSPTQSQKMLAIAEQSQKRLKLPDKTERMSELQNQKSNLQNNALYNSYTAAPEKTSLQISRMSSDQIREHLQSLTQNNTAFAAAITSLNALPDPRSALRYVLHAILSNAPIDIEQARLQRDPAVVKHPIPQTADLRNAVAAVLQAIVSPSTLPTEHHHATGESQALQKMKAGETRGKHAPTQETIRFETDATLIDPSGMAADGPIPEKSPKNSLQIDGVKYLQKNDDVKKEEQGPERTRHDTEPDTPPTKLAPRDQYATEQSTVTDLQKSRMDEENAARAARAPTWADDAKEAFPDRSETETPEDHLTKRPSTEDPDEQSAQSPSIVDDEAPFSPPDPSYKQSPDTSDGYPKPPQSQQPIYMDPVTERETARPSAAAIRPEHTEWTASETEDKAGVSSPAPTSGDNFEDGTDPAVKRGEQSVARLAQDISETAGIAEDAAVTAKPKLPGATQPRAPDEEGSTDQTLSSSSETPVDAGSPVSNGVTPSEADLDHHETVAPQGPEEVPADREPLSRPDRGKPQQSARSKQKFSNEASARSKKPTLEPINEPTQHKHPIRRDGRESSGSFRRAELHDDGRRTGIPTHNAMVHLGREGPEPTNPGTVEDWGLSQAENDTATQLFNALMRTGVEGGRQTSQEETELIKEAFRMIWTMLSANGWVLQKDQTGFWGAALHTAIHAPPPLSFDQAVQRFLEVACSNNPERDRALRMLIAQCGYARRDVSPVLRRRIASVLRNMLAPGDGNTPPKPTVPALETPDMQPAELTQRAGLVLFHPHLKLLFDRLKIKHSSHGIDLADAARAVACLQEIASGEPSAEQPTDPIERCLLGLPLDWANLSPVICDDDEKAVIEGLLNAVISQWGKLGNTNTEALRTAFIQRDGVLRIEPGEAARLTVEPAAYDMLLDSLPWSISTISLPWMRIPLYVDWRQSHD